MTESETQPERFWIKANTSLTDIPCLPYVLCLMMSHDMIRSIGVWQYATREDKSVSGMRNLLASTLLGMGCVGETLLFVKKGAKQGHIRREMIAGDPALSRLWEELHSNNPPELLKKIYRVRDKFFAHWDESVAEDFIKLQARGEQIQPFLESDSEGKAYGTRYPWVQAAFVYQLVKNLNDEQEIRRLMDDLTQVIGQTSALVSKLLEALMKPLINEGRLSIEPWEEQTK